MRIVLASGSPYRKLLLTRLGLPFHVDAPAVDETPRRNESAAALAERLARMKADAVAARHPASLVIGCDQVVTCDGRLFGKPGGASAARAQLSAMSGRTVDFLTALCLVNTTTGAVHTVVEPYAVTFRTLTPSQIAAYVERDRPFDCAGSFRSEGLGVVLVATMAGADPSALVGLPLITLVTFLAHEGVSPLPV
jgi:septum formation protein